MGAHQDRDITALLKKERKPHLVRNALRIGGDPQIDVLLTKTLKPELWNLQHVIAAMREHAFSYFSVPFSLDALQRMIRIAADGFWPGDGIEIVSATEQRIRLKVRCDFETADRLLQFLQEIQDLPDPERGQLATASRELLCNAIEHGGKLDPTNHVEIDCVRSPDGVSCRITDHGPGFRFDKISHAAVANATDDPTYHIGVRQEQGMRPGGYGILVARQLLD